MIPDEAPPAREPAIGDNSGSMLVAARQEVAAALHDTPRDGGKTFAQRRSEFVASAKAQVVRDRQSAADAADTIKLAGEVWAVIDAERRKVSDPYRETHLALSAQATEFWAPVLEAMDGLREQIDAWTAEEDKRIEAQRAEQQAELARMRAPAPPAPREHIDYSTAERMPVLPPPLPPSAPAMRPAKRAPIRGDLGSTISQRDVVGYEIEDISLLPDHIMQSKTVTDAILTVVRQTAKHFGVPKGIRVLTGTGNQIR